MVSSLKMSNTIIRKPTNQRHSLLSLEASASNTNKHARTFVSDTSDGGMSSIATSTLNLAKSIIGAGVLSLPSGVAYLADERTALVPSIAICTLFGIIAAYSFSVIGRICKENDAKSFQEAWEKVVSPKSAWLISGSITALCFLASLAYCIMLGDTFSSLFQVQLLIFSIHSLLILRS